MRSLRFAISLATALLFICVFAATTHAFRQQCPSWISEIAESGVSCTLMTGTEKDAMDDGQRGRLPAGDAIRHGSGVPGAGTEINYMGDRQLHKQRTRRPTP
jgi:hypothetical protein